MAEKRPIDEEAVFNVALDVLVCRGYKEATMVELAEATGVQRGTLYHAYGGKEELFLWAFNNLAGKFYDRVRHALQKPDRRAALYRPAARIQRSSGVLRRYRPVPEPRI
jgi:TetR/AcrR family transcriptional repressor of nem operon